MGLHRYYDPQTGRYVTSDPIGLRGGMNTYGYAGGNPLYWIDPDGLNALALEGVISAPKPIPSK
ncbi:RHS repeat-associated core domain-containing protein [Arenicella sp. 4NH20-0111]|uniref:RHS repeat-associated core domain-containing protein n=1 Tax=Arenicella sp. 4NH20-0111 TaxID=3127648 RepID=UPI0033422B4F